MFQYILFDEKINPLKPGLVWLTEEQFLNLGGMTKKIYPYNEGILIPHLVTEFFNPSLCMQALVYGLILAYDVDEETASYTLEITQHDVRAYKENYRRLFNNIMKVDISFNEQTLLDLLRIYEKHRDGREQIEMFRAVIQIYPTSKTRSYYAHQESSFLNKNPKEANLELFYSIQENINSISPDEISPEANESLKKLKIWVKRNIAANT